MKRQMALVVLLVVLALFSGFLLGVSAQSTTICDFFVKTPEVGMLPVGTVVDFQHWEGGATTVTRTGRVACYYIRAKFPDGGGIIGLDDQAYVVDYGDPHDVFTILNRAALTVR